MLDLEKLEDNLDSALAKETSESLTNWLHEKRLKAFLQTLGEGKLENIHQFSNNSIVPKSNLVSFEIEYCSVLSTQEYLAV